METTMVLLILFCSQLFHIGNCVEFRFPISSSSQEGWRILAKIGSPSAEYLMSFSALIDDTWLFSNKAVARPLIWSSEKLLYLLKRLTIS